MSELLNIWCAYMRDIDAYVPNMKLFHLILWQGEVCPDANTHHDAGLRHEV